MSGLKACPFCGRIPDIEDCGEHQWFIRCKCGIAQDKLFFQKCDAVRAWNKRKELRVKDTNVPITDTISRQAAIDAIAKEAYRHTYIEQIIDIINNLPSAEPVRMKGWWRDITASDCSGYDPTLAGYDDPVVGYVCSNCGDGYEKEVMGEVLWNFCPNCGADMGGR